LINLKANDFACGVGVMILGLGLNFYSATELLATLLLLSVAFSLLGLVALTVFGAYYAGKRVAVWAPIASPNAPRLSRDPAPATSGTAE
jgi:hypothetical protein